MGAEAGAILGRGTIGNLQTDGRRAEGAGTLAQISPQNCALPRVSKAERPRLGYCIR